MFSSFNRNIKNAVIVSSLASMSVLARSALCETVADTSKASFSPKEFRPFPVEKVTTVNHNTKLIRCKLPSQDHVMGLTTASCVMVKGQDDAEGKIVSRPYTPISTESDKGYFELLVKGYPNGVVSKHLTGLKAGDNVEVKGPFPKLKYTANMKKSISMIAGGTGITPMIQVLKEIVSNKNDNTEVYLIFANVSEEDILLKSTLDEWASKHKNFKVKYILDKPSSSWKGEKGHINKALVGSFIPQPSSDTIVFVCGPPGFMGAVSGDKTKDYKQGEVSGILKELHFTEDMVYKF